ncbi:MAG: hypothetical protein E7022_06195 [Desulfovibrio desulfuricans]|jgi:hypothetical protein|nr:hypothetical protein [Desulfovibrio desulfuricans]
MEDTSEKFTWHCQRMGGADQVTLTSMAELRHLRELDPKLWGALSCPADGIEFNKRTLELLDADHDGRIRMPEVLDAVEWFCARVNDSADIAGRPAALPLAAIDDTTDAGKRLRTTARSVLDMLERPDGDSLTQEDVEKAVASAAGQSFNGDGVLPPLPEMDDAVRDFVNAGLAVVGGARDAGGAAGLNRELAAALVTELQAWQAWRAEVDAAPHPVEGTPEAWTLLEDIRAKVDDYFLRCRLAAFAPQAEAPLNGEERLLAATDKPDIDTDVLTALPLARILPDAALPLKSGLNPVWSDRVLRFAALVRPLLAVPDVLSREDWKAVQEALAPYGAALAKRPAVGVYEAGAFAPAADAAAAIDALGADGVRRLLDSGAHQRFQELCDTDLAGAAATEDIAELERLVLYYLHLHRLLMNFVSFYDFYSLRKDVTFRAGTLYMDGRSCQLCLPVEDIKAHNALAAMSGLCLLYCKCTRRVDDGAPSGERMIMAALTAGDDDVLMEGRNGVFVDNTGADWDATLVKIVHNPISFRQAIWAPYKRISQFIGEQIAKFAAAKHAETLDAAKGAVAAAPKQPAAPFDMGKNVGIFAAVGIALGAIGTAVGSIAQALFSLSWWQFPLLIAGIFIIISGPSVFLAWLKFRKRTLGPVLEASGWAVNSQLPINLKLGSALTAIAKQPENIERRSVIDPFREEEKSHAGLWTLLVILVAALALGGWLWKSGRLDGLASRLIPPQQQAETAPAKADAPAAAQGKDAAKADAGEAADAGGKKDGGTKGEARPGEKDSAK